MSMTIACVDAFTDRPFSGNQAGVCLPDTVRDDAWMQQVAAEMNLAETAFVSQGTGDAFVLRWFTPTTQMNLCGHATLAAAHLLWTEGRVPANQTIAFDTHSGRLTASQRGDLIELDFPAEPATEEAPPANIAEVLGEEPLWFGRNRLDYIAELRSEAGLRAIMPRMDLIAEYPVRGLIVTTRSTGGEYDFVSRFFAPRVGIPEDPVTGSAHCCLGPFWAGRLNKTTLVGYQASARGGVVRVALEGTRVMLRGHAVTVHRGTLFC